MGINNTQHTNKLKSYFSSAQKKCVKVMRNLINKILYSNNSIVLRDNVLQDSRVKFSKQVSKLICENYQDEKENSSFIFGLSGKWGVGKTLFLKQLEIDLERDEEFTIVTVSPWKYGSENLTFLRNFLMSLNDKAEEERLMKYNKPIRHVLSLFKKKLPENLTKDVTIVKFGFWYFVVVVILSLAWIVYKQFIPQAFVVKINTDLKYLKQLIITIFSLLIIPKVASFITFQEQNKAMSTLDEFDTILEKILNKFPKTTKIAVFVDDLDRVNPEIARNVLDTLRTFFDKPKITFVVTGDHSVLERHIGSQIFPDATIPEQIEEGKRYLKKVFNVYWPLPTQNNSEFDSFLGLLIQDKTSLKKYIFNRKPKQLVILRKWLLTYFEKNFRNVKRFVDTVIFNFDVINNQLINVTPEVEEQLKDLKRYPLLVVRMLMIQEFASPLFEDYLRTPSLVGQIEYEIVSKNGDALFKHIKDMNTEKRLSTSQEQFLKTFMYEKPSFYDPEKGGIVVRSIDPFLYLAASSDFSDIRGLFEDDFISLLEKNNQELMLTALENSGPQKLKSITELLIKHLNDICTSNPDSFAPELLNLVEVVSRISKEKPVHKLFSNLFTKVDMTKAFLDEVDNETKAQLYSKFWAWLDIIPNNVDIEHYFNKFKLNSPDQIVLLDSILNNLKDLGSFSSQIIMKWLVFVFETNKESSIKYLDIIKNKIIKKSFEDLIPIKDELISLLISNPNSVTGQQIFNILLSVNLMETNKTLDQNVSEQIESNNQTVSDWLADNFDSVKELTGSVKILESITKIIEDISVNVERLNNLYQIHSKLLLIFNNEIWSRVINGDIKLVYNFVNVVQQNQMINLYPIEGIANNIMIKLFGYASSMENDQNESNILLTLKKSEFWRQLGKLSILSRLNPKVRAKHKPLVRNVVIDIVASWQQ